MSFPNTQINFELANNFVCPVEEDATQPFETQPSAVHEAATKDDEDVEFVQETPLNGEEHCEDMCQ